ncbi:MAG: hypothetical protein Q4B28_03010 [bacterium]|nr:hypothetical protein [bacterium]
MKKLFCSLFLIGVVGMMTVSAGNVKVEQVATSYAQCIPAQSKDVYYYIPNDTVKYRPWDNITASKPAILVASKTKVEMWNPNNLISQCGDWSTIGNIIPGGRQQTLALHNFDGCVFTKPNYSKAQDPNKLDAQIHYSVAFWTLNDTSPNKATASFAYTTKAKFDQSPREYTCYPSGQKVAKPADCPKATVKYQKVNGDAEYHNGECLNYRVFWCGDGLVNRPDGSTEYNNGTANEQCDPNDPNKTGWGNGGCDTSCKPINNPEPVCSSTYHNTTTYNTNFPTPRMQQTAPLCTQGKVGEFVFDATTGKYTWKCNGEA